MTTKQPPAQPAVPPSKALKPIDVLKKDIQNLEPQFKKALPVHIPVEKFSRVLMTALSTNNDLVQATRPSLFAACMRLAGQGLLPDGREAAIVTFKNKQGELIAQDMPMVAGILKKVRNSGELAMITAQVIYENDKFRYWVDGDGEHIIHEPNLFSERGKRIGVYALAKTKDGAVYIEPMTVEQVMDVKNVSRSKDRGPWAGDFEDEMWRKTAIRRLSKRLPMSTDLEGAIHADDQLYDLDPEPGPEAPPPEKKVKSSRLAKLVGKKVDDLPPILNPNSPSYEGPEEQDDERDPQTADVDTGEIPI